MRSFGAMFGAASGSSSGSKPSSNSVLGAHDLPIQQQQQQRQASGGGGRAVDPQQQAARSPQEFPPALDTSIIKEIAEHERFDPSNKTWSFLHLNDSDPKRFLADQTAEMDEFPVGGQTAFLKLLAEPVTLEKLLSKLQAREDSTRTTAALDGHQQQHQQHHQTTTTMPEWAIDASHPLCIDGWGYASRFDELDDRGPRPYSVQTVVRRRRWVRVLHHLPLLSSASAFPPSSLGTSSANNQQQVYRRASTGSTSSAVGGGDGVGATGSRGMGIGMAAVGVDYDDTEGEDAFDVIAGGAAIVEGGESVNSVRYIADDNASEFGDALETMSVTSEITTSSSIFGFTSSSPSIATAAAGTVQPRRRSLFGFSYSSSSSAVPSTTTGSSNYNTASAAAATAAGYTSAASIPFRTIANSSGLYNNEIHLRFSSDPTLVTLGKEIRSLEAICIQQEEAKLKEWKAVTRPDLEFQINALEGICDRLKKKIEKEVTQGLEHINKLEEELKLITDNLEAKKRRFYFPNSQHAVGQAGVYIGIDDLWIEQASGNFVLDLIPDPLQPQIVFALAPTRDNPQCGISLRLKAEGFKLAGDRGKGVPKISLENMKLTLALNASIRLLFDVPTQNWVCAARDFKLEILSLKAPYGIGKSLVGMVLPIITPILRGLLLKSIPYEVGQLVQSLPAPFSLSGEFDVSGTDLSVLASPLHQSAVICSLCEYSPIQLEMFYWMQKSMERSKIIKTMSDLLVYMRTFTKFSSVWEKILNMWSQLCRIYCAKVAGESTSRENAEDFENGKYDFNFDTLLAAADDVLKKRFVVKFRLKNLDGQISLNALIAKVYSLSHRLVSEQLLKADKLTKLEHARTLQLMAQIQKTYDLACTILKLAKQNLDFLSLKIRAGVHAGPAGEMAVTVEDLRAQLPLLLEAALQTEKNIGYPSLVPYILSIKPRLDGNLCIEIIHSAYDMMRAEGGSGADDDDNISLPSQACSEEGELREEGFSTSGNTGNPPNSANLDNEGRERETREGRERDQHQKRAGQNSPNQRGNSNSAVEGGGETKDAPENANEELDLLAAVEAANLAAASGAQEFVTADSEKYGVTVRSPHSSPRHHQLSGSATATATPTPNSSGTSDGSAGTNVSNNKNNNSHNSKNNNNWNNNNYSHSNSERSSAATNTLIAAAHASEMAESSQQQNNNINNNNGPDRVQLIESYAIHQPSSSGVADADVHKDVDASLALPYALASLDPRPPAESGTDPLLPPAYATSTVTTATVGSAAIAEQNASNTEESKAQGGSNSGGSASRNPFQRAKDNLNPGKVQEKLKSAIHTSKATVLAAGEKTNTLFAKSSASASNFVHKAGHLTAGALGVGGSAHSAGLESRSGDNGTAHSVSTIPSSSAAGESDCGEEKVGGGKQQEGGEGCSEQEGEGKGEQGVGGGTGFPDEGEGSGKARGLGERINKTRQDARNNARNTFRKGVHAVQGSQRFLSNTSSQFSASLQKTSARIIKRTSSGGVSGGSGAGVSRSGSTVYCCSSDGDEEDDAENGGRENENGANSSDVGFDGAETSGGYYIDGEDIGEPEREREQEHQDPSESLTGGFRVDSTNSQMDDPSTTAAAAALVTAAGGSTVRPLLQQQHKQQQQEQQGVSKGGVGGVQAQLANRSDPAAPYKDTLAFASALEAVKAVPAQPQQPAASSTVATTATTTTTATPSAFPQGNKINLSPASSSSYSSAVAAAPKAPSSSRSSSASVAGFNSSQSVRTSLAAVPTAHQIVRNTAMLRELEATLKNPHLPRCTYGDIGDSIVSVVVKNPHVSMVVDQPVQLTPQVPLFTFVLGKREGSGIATTAAGGSAEAGATAGMGGSRGEGGGDGDVASVASGGSGARSQATAKNTASASVTASATAHLGETAAGLTANVLGCPMFVQTGPSVKLLTHVPSAEVLINLPALIRFCLAHFEDLHSLKRYLEITLGGEFSEEALIMTRFLVQKIAKYVLLPGLRLDANILGKVVAQGSDIVVHLETPPQTVEYANLRDGNTHLLGSSSNASTDEIEERGETATAAAAANNFTVFVRAEFNLRDVLEDVVAFDALASTGGGSSS